MHVYLHIAMAACYIICYNLNVVVSVNKKKVYYPSVNCLRLPRTQAFSPQRLSLAVLTWEKAW